MQKDHWHVRRWWRWWCKGTLLWQLRCQLYIIWEDAIYSKLKSDQDYIHCEFKSCLIVCNYSGPSTPANSHRLVHLPRPQHSHNKYPTSVSYWCVRRRYRSCCGVRWWIIGVSQPYLPVIVSPYPSICCSGAHVFRREVIWPRGVAVSWIVRSPSQGSFDIVWVWSSGHRDAYPVTSSSVSSVSQSCCSTHRKTIVCML